ncbi:Box C/D snoRNA protein 1, partial [Stegodyphus mimosarum]
MEDALTHGSVFQSICATCSAPSKYRCPKCSVLSCSLQCVKAHKQEKNCDGIREKTAFVPAEEFKDRHLLSDYHFLEEIGRTVDNANRAKRSHGCFHYLPPNLYRLKMAAKARKTDLQILPMVFSKRKISTTYIRYSDRKIFWRIEWNFPLCNFSCADERIDEEELLGKCLDKYLLPEKSDSLRDKLQYYHSMGHSGVVVLLKKEDSTANDLKYYILKQNKSLKKNFRRKRIIEFP